jgi:hypothetical protein
LLSPRAGATNSVSLTFEMRACLLEGKLASNLPIRVENSSGAFMLNECSSLLAPLDNLVAHAEAPSIDEMT